MDKTNKNKDTTSSKKNQKKVSKTQTNSTNNTTTTFNNNKTNTVIESIKHVIIYPKQKLLFLYTFLRKFSDKKVLVYFNTKQQISFYTKLFKALNLNNNKVNYTFFSDIQDINNDNKEYEYVFYYDLLINNNAYSTYLPLFAKNSLTLIMPSEEDFYLNSNFYSFLNNKKSIECKFPANFMCQIQTKVESLVNETFELYEGGREAYKSYMNNYVLKNSTIGKEQEGKFMVDKLDIKTICYQFGMTSPIYIDFYKKI